MEWTQTDLDNFVVEVWGFRLLPWQLQDLMKFVRGGIFSYSVPTDHGKAYKCSGLVPTEAGWKLHGELEPGDWVLSPNGHGVPVLAVAPPCRATMRVFFSDGSDAVVHANHEWLVYDRPHRRYSIRTTGDLARLKLLTSSGNGSGRVYDRPSYQLPRVMPLQLPDARLAIDPYTLGAWLGDGSSTAAVLCGAASDLWLICNRIPYVLGSRWQHQTTGVWYQNFLGLHSLLRKEGLYNNKHIPIAYLRGSERQRRALLAGLIDTDGYVDKGGQAVFTGVNERLVRDVAALATTLGYRANVSVCYPKERDRKIKDRRPIWMAQWRIEDGLPQGTLSRKAISLPRSQRKIGIVGIESTSPEEANCIQVPGGLYLVGERMLPTHNSMLIEMAACARLCANPNRRILIVKINDIASREVVSELARRMFQISQLRDGGAPAFPGTAPMLRWTKDKEGIDPWGIGLGFDIEGRNFTERNVNRSVKGYALGSRDIQGKRGDTFVDDVERQEEANSEAYRKQLQVRIGAVLRTIESKIDTTWMIVGTPFHADSVYSYITRRLEGMESRRYEHIHRPFKNPDGSYLWPERAEKIELHRRTMDKSAFAAAYELTPIKTRALTPVEIEEKIRAPWLPWFQNERQVWDYLVERARSHCPPWKPMAEWLFEREEHLRRYLMFYVSWDPATVGDWAIVALAIYGDEVILLRCKVAVGDTWEQILVVRDYFLAFPSAQIMWESNAQQKAFADLLVADEVLSQAHLVGVGTGRTKHDDQVGLPAMMDAIHEGHFKTPYLDRERSEKEFVDFEEELTHYSETAHPHSLPAIWFAWRWHRQHVLNTSARRKIREREVQRKTETVKIATPKVPMGNIASPQSAWLRQRTREAWTRRA